MEEKVVRKTTAKKTVRKTPVRRAASSVGVARKSATPASTVLRKAPPRVAVGAPLGVLNTPKRGGTIKILAIGFFLFAVLTGVSALIGYSDKGQLDVSGVIAQRKQNATEEEKQILDTVPTEQVQPSAPNGGLVGMGAPEPVPVVPETTASTTENTASTTDAVNSDGSPEDQPENTTDTETTQPQTQISDPQATEVSDAQTAEA